MAVADPITPFRSHSPFAGTGVGLGRYTFNGFQLDLIADFNRDAYWANDCADYTFNGFELSLVADFNKDFYAGC